MPLSNKMIVLMVCAFIFSAIALLTILPLQALIGLTVMVTDSCTDISLISEILWAGSYYSIIPLISISIVGMWFAAFKRSVKLFISMLLLPLLTVLLNILFIGSLSALGC
jgi:hypothetical protein